jgi:hypothetical protein
MKRNLTTLATILLLIASSSALAAPPADNSNATERARAVFHQGVQLYNDGSFEAALAEFRKAYQISPNYRLLYNIAQTYFDLHDYVSSWKTLKQYVQEGGGELLQSRRMEVNDLNQKLEERIGHLDIACNVDGADIRIDDISVGASPLPLTIMVNAGPRRVTVIKAGYAVAARVVTVGGKETAKLAFDLAPLASSGVAKGMPFGDGEAGHKPKRVGLITSGVVTAGCAIATGVLGIFALRAKDDFDRELGRIPNSKASIDSARSRMKNLAYSADAMGAATLISGGVMLYFLLSDSGSQRPSNKTTVALSPTVGGLLLHGEW